MARILLFNPNSSATVTADIERSVTGLRNDRHTIRCVANPDGPPGIETDAHTEQVVPHVVAAMCGGDADIGVVACFSDPGVAAARAATGRPILGIAEAAYHAAMGVSHRFGIISIVTASVGRHRRHLERLGLLARLAGDRPLDLPVAQLHERDVFTRLVETGSRLREKDGAEAVILGCAGLGTYREDLQRRLGVPVIDPIQVAVAQALLILQLGLKENPATSRTPGDHPIF